MTWVGLAGALALATLSLLSTPRLLRALPEPASPGHDKTPYADLATPLFAVATACAALVAGLVVVATTPAASWPSWLVYAAAGGLAVAVDAATTWMPNRLMRPLAAGVTLGLGGWAWATQDAGLLVRALLGAALVGGFFYLFYLPNAGIGFADVRLMGVVGGLTAAQSPVLTGWSVLIGTGLGAIWGLVHRLRHGPGPFPYGPALWAGPLVALIASAGRLG